jgi:peptidyl-prolyl cis-trans isomerase C
MNHPRILCLVALLAALSACQPKTAGVTTPTDTSPPVATVNGSPISRDFFEFYIKGITNKSSADLTTAQRNLALDNLIRAKLVDDEAVKEGLDKSGDTPFLLNMARYNVLQQVLSDKYLKDRKPTEQELRAEYESQLNAMPKTEFHVRHILVASEPGAQKIIDRLDKGEKFDEIAKKESQDPSSRDKGGDLPWFTPDRMIPEIAGAVLALKPGEYTHKPIHTQYGWHVLQLLETREITPPPFEQVKARLTQVVQAKKFRAYADELMHGAKIEKFLDTGSAPASGATGGAPAADATSAAPAPAPAPAATPEPTPAAPPKN